MVYSALSVSTTHEDHSMTPERWQQVKEHFQAAQALAAPQRAPWLAAACVGDEDLRQEVESLLAAYEEPDDWSAQPPPRQSAEAAELISGQSLGPYVVEHKLGQGGMGVVYRARDTRLGRALALKLLHQPFTLDTERVRRFQQEARAASALNHPNILTIYEDGQFEATHFIATELVEGQTLRALLAQQPLSASKALDIVIQVLGALVAAHQAGIIHRDIKPENIMVRPDGIVKVLDFGLAKLSETRKAERGTLNEEAKQSQKSECGARNQEAEPSFQASSDIHRSSFIVHRSTMPGIVMGTVAYMSPEQARGVGVDARSDLFSVGVVLYEMLTGELPFAGATPSDIMAALLERAPLPLAQHRVNLPSALQPMLDRALAKQVATRYQTAAEWLTELKSLKQALDFSAKLESVSPNAETVAWTDTNAVPPPMKGRKAARQTTSGLRFLTNYWPPQLARLARRRTVLWMTLLALVVAGGIFITRWKKPPAPPLNSLAVLPFLNVGNDPQMEYLSDGLTESLIDSLTHLSSLRIKARSMVFAYKGREVDPRQVGKDLGVQAVVLGRVQQQGNSPLIRAELVDTTDGSQLWSREYRVPLSGLLAVQEEIAREVVTKLQLALSRQEQSVLARSQTTSPEAYKLFLEGRYHWNKRTSAGMNKGLEFFQQAIAQDPNYALAYVGLADAYATLGSYHIKPAKEAFPLARAAAEKALKIDDTLAEAHATMGKIITDFYWEWEPAEREFQRAITLNPKYTNGHHWYSTLLVQQGRFDQAISEARLALDLDPLSAVLGRQLGYVLYRARRYDEGIAVLQKTLELEPTHLTAYFYLGHCLLLQGKRAEALTAFQKANEISPHLPDFLAILGYTHAVLGQREQALQYQSQLTELATHSYASPHCFATLALGLGQLDEVFKWMEKSYEARDSHLRGLMTDPLFDSLHADARFVALMRRAGLQ